MDCPRQRGDTHAFQDHVGDGKGMLNQQDNLIHRRRKSESGALHHHLLLVL